MIIYTMALHSLQVEKHILGGLIQNPEVISDLEQFVQEKDFAAEPHNVIFSCLRLAYLNNEKIDKVLLAQKIKNLGISFKDNINIFDYIEAISFSPVTAAATKKAAQELVKLRVLRDMDSMCDTLKTHVNKSAHQELSQTISEVDEIYGATTNLFEIEDEPDDLFSDIYDLVEERGNNPVNEIGYPTPYAEFNRMYGGLRGGNVYSIASRPGQGKTSWLNHLACETARLNNFPVLILDTEMTKEEIKFRNAASFSGVPLWYLETGLWRKDPAMVEKVRTKLKDLKNQYRVYHYYVGNKPIDQVMSIIRRWYYKVVGRDKPCLVVYDYLKLTGEKVDKNWAEYQALGEKVDKLKRCAVDLKIPIFTAVQLNRSGENSSKHGSAPTDDGSAIAMSDRLSWFGTYLAIFRRKTHEEMALDTPASGTHKLIEIKARYQGRDAAGHHDMVLRHFPDGSKKYVRNYINFTVDNFFVKELGSLKDAIERQRASYLITDAPEVKISEDTV